MAMLFVYTIVICCCIFPVCLTIWLIKTTYTLATFVVAYFLPGATTRKRAISTTARVIQFVITAPVVVGDPA